MRGVSSIRYLKYHLDPREFEELPVDWAKVFGREAELVVEIGFGSGEFLEEMAVSNPGVNFVGFEVSLTSATKAQKRFYRRGIENVRVVLVDARFGMRELFADESVSRVIANFPCPWPKRKHEERRLIVPEFSRTLAAVLRKGGDFELVTDELWFAEEAMERFGETGCFEVEGPVVNPERLVRTRYERKWRAQGKDIYLVRFVKKKGLKVERIAGGREMPHYVVSREVSLEEVRRLVGLKYSEGESVFVIKEVFCSPDGEGFLLRAFSSDAGFQQHYFIKVARRGKKWLVKLDSASLPYRTTAVKLSVYKVGRVLDGLPLEEGR